MTNYKKIDKIYKNNYGGKIDENKKIFINGNILFNKYGKFFYTEYRGIN